jgi:Aspartyl/asparaginyl-tRNA synthetases
MSYTLEEIPKPIYEETNLKRRKTITKVTTYTLKYFTNYFIEKGFEWFLPVILSKSTDPLWPDPGTSIEKRVETEIYGENVRLMLSMIVHKMIISSLLTPKMFVLSPNIRIERRERAFTGIHCFEFTQLDFEIRYANSRDVMSLVEDLLNKYLSDIKKDLEYELKLLGTYDKITYYNSPFKVYDREELENKFGKKWEEKIKKEIKEPVWIVNIPREFYDFEDFETNKWDNYDLYLPNIGEVLSGSRREYEYEKIVKKMERDGVRKENYNVLLKLAKEGKLKSSAGAGIGIERIIAWVCGCKHIGEVQPFPRIPGYVFEL